MGTCTIAIIGRVAIHGRWWGGRRARSVEGSVERDILLLQSNISVIREDLRFPNAPSPAGCDAHPEILNLPSVGGPFFVIIAKPWRPWTSSPFPPLPLTYSTVFSSSATTVGASSTSMSPGIPPAVGSFSSYVRRFPYQSAPRFLLFDHDQKYGLEVPAAIHSMNMACVQTSIHRPWQNGVAERWVGSCRRMCSTTSSR